MPESRKFSAERVAHAVRNRATPIRGFTPALLVSWIEEWRSGYLRSLALLWEELEDRDPTLKGVIAKRKRAAARSDWEVTAEDDSPEATAQREFLEDFYQRLTATSLLEQDNTGGVSLMLRQMMDAQGRRYSVHEIVWIPRRDGTLSAHLIHCPLWFFEARTGRLRFLREDFAIDGQEMRPREWMVTVGDGLMMASAITWVAKDLAWKDWLNYSERFGQPIIDCATDATKDSAEWDALKESLANLAADGQILRNRAATVSLLESKGSGSQPQPELVERVDRALASLWRGGDLSTLSAQSGTGQGASLQAEESEELTMDDCEVLTETLANRLSLPALQWKFGPDVRPLARIQIRRAGKRGIADEIQVDRFLIENGYRLSVADAGERYGRPLAEDDEPVLRPAAAAAAPGAASPARAADGPVDLEDVEDPQDVRDPAILANVAQAQTQAIREAFARDLQPVADRLRAILTIEDPQIFATKLQALRDEAPALLRDLGADPEVARELERVMAAAMLDGLTSRTSTASAA